MAPDPVALSIAALGVSVVALAFSIRNAVFERRLQFEQVRSELRAKVTEWGIEVATLSDKLTSVNGDKQVVLAKTLVCVAADLVEIREGLRRLKFSTWSTNDALLGKLASLRGDVSEAEPVFERLRVVVSEDNLAEAQQAAIGLLERTRGKKAAHAEHLVAADAHYDARR